MANLVRITVPESTTTGCPRYDRLCLSSLEDQTRIESSPAKFLDEHHPQAVALDRQRTEDMQDRGDCEWTMGQRSTAK